MNHSTITAIVAAIRELELSQPADAPRANAPEAANAQDLRSVRTESTATRHAVGA